MAQTYGGGGGSPFNYFSSGTSTNPYQQASAKAAPKPKKKSTYYSSGTATKPKPYTQTYKPPKPPSPPRSPAPRNYGSAGGGGGGTASSYRSGKSVGSNASGRIAKTAAPAAKPPAPAMTADQIAKTFNQWSGGDLVYKAQKDALANALTDYTTRGKKEGEDYKIQNAANRKVMESDRDKSRLDVINDYAARGMLGNAQQQALTDFDTDWTKRLTDFDTAYTDWQNQQQQALQDYTASNSLQLTKAQQDAIARRVASYGL